MKIFELHFNPKKKKDIVLDSFIYEPENIEEQKLGSLYIVGRLFNPLPRHSCLLNELSSIIKKEYFKETYQNSEQSLRQGLKCANKFLTTLNEQGDVSWLGNLDFVVLGLKDFIFNFTKIGNIKILIMRGEEIIDLGENLEFQNTSSHSLKVFDNIVSGNLISNDKILVLTKGIYEYFIEYGLLKRISTLSFIQEKKLEAILKPHKNNLFKISGVCLLFCLEPIRFIKKEAKTTVLQKKDKKDKEFYSYSVSFLSILKKLINFFIKIILKLKKLFVVFVIKIFNNRFFVKLFSSLKTLLLNLFHKIAEKFSWLIFFKTRKNILLIIALILMLIIGYLVFG